MHTPGHVGLGLLLFTPIGVTLAMVGEPVLVLAGLGVAVVTAPLPDVDEFTPLRHRGVTHSLPVLILGSAGLALAGALVGEHLLAVSPIWLGAVCGGVALVTLVSHLAADALTPMGIRPLWPLSIRHVSLDVVRSANPRLNWTVFLLGVTVSGISGAVLWYLGAVPT